MYQAPPLVGQGQSENATEYEAAKKEAMELKIYYENNPDQLNFILNQNRDLAEAVLSEDPTLLIQIVLEMVSISLLEFIFL